MLFAKLESAAASAKLWIMLLKLRDPSVLYKIWGTAVVNKARANARAKGGRRLWKQIADAVRIKSVSARGVQLDCVGLWGRIGLHKQHGGPIKVKNKSWLTIPINQLAYGKTAEELGMEGFRLFRPGKKGQKKKILAYNRDGVLVPVFALCKKTRPQRPDRWLPDDRWILARGIAEAKRQINLQN